MANDLTDLNILIPALTFVSAALQRFIETFDWVWELAGKGWALAWAPKVKDADGKLRGQVTDELVKEKKGYIILLVSFLVGYKIAGTIPPATLGGFDKLLSNKEFREILVGFMLAGTTNGTNSVLKYLQALKDGKQAQAAQTQLATTGLALGADPSAGGTAAILGRMKAEIDRLRLKAGEPPLP